MILLDTNVLIYAAEPTGSLGEWARKLIEDAVAGEGAGANAICLAEVCAGDGRPETVADRIRDWGVAILDVPGAAAEICAAAHSRYMETRRQRSDSAVPGTPLPDFFIGAHAKVMGWSLATVDAARFTTYFPSVPIIAPSRR